MLIDRTHRRWLFVSAIVFAAATAAYVWYANTIPNGPRGGTVMGLVFGILGTLMMTFAGLLAGRKQFPIAEIPIPFRKKGLRLGSAQFWLRGHIWLGLLSVPMILYHSGFAWGGLVENLLWITFGFVIVSGIYGLIVQQVFPRFLTSRVPLETFVQQIPYVSKRSQILADRMVAEHCGKLEIQNDPLYPLFVRIAEFTKTASKDDKGNWIDLVGDDLRPLFLDLARHAKQSRWIRAETDFATFLEDVYADVVSKAEAAITGAKPAGKKASPLEQARKQATADGDKPAAELPTAKGGVAAAGKKPMSPLERARAQAAAKAGAAEAPATDAKPASKLEQARAQAAAKAAGGDGDGAGAKKLSPLELARQQAAAKKGGGGGGSPAAENSAPAAPQKKLSPLELARQQAAAKKGGGAAAAATAEQPAKKLSPLELARQQGGAGSGDTSGKSPATPAGAKVKEPATPKEAAPAAAAAAAATTTPTGKTPPRQMSPEEVESEVVAIKNLLMQDYAFAEERANFAAEQARRFLAPPAAATPDAPKKDGAVPRAVAPKRERGPATATMTFEEIGEFMVLGCPFCGFEVQLRDERLVGRAARCPNCREKFLLISPEPEPDEDENEPEAAAPAEESPAGRLSPLEQARRQAAAKSAAAAPPGEGNAKPKAMSPVEMARRQGAAGAAAKPAAAGKGGSPLELARAQAAAKAAGAAAGDKPASKLEQARAQAAKSAGAKPMPAAAKKTPAPAKTSAAAGKPAAAKPPIAKKPAPGGPKKKSGPVPRAAELKAFYLGDVRPFLSDEAPTGSQLADGTVSGRVFAQLRAELPTELHGTLGELEGYCEQRRQFSVGRRIHRWLHWWLMVHIPVSVVLFVLFIAHLVMALRVDPFTF
ncbi:MAG: zinc-ribbon domain-containing protein [Planctomycetes bacterium]|nr:zinc-ribbon domain-containing protein [Planctomycetota bacterium]